MTYANFGCNRLKGGHFATVQNLPFTHDFNGWPYNRQALTCCRDDCRLATGPLLHGSLLLVLENHSSTRRSAILVHAAGPQLASDRL